LAWQLLEFPVEKLTGAAAPMLDPLVFKAVSYGFILLPALTALFLSLLSLKREYVSGKSLDGLFVLVLTIAGLCGLISVLTGYVDVKRPLSVLLKWERAAFSVTE
jgi:hypothetical protein